MQIPSIPTDNLYKFICFSGLMLLIISPIYFQLFDYQVTIKKLDLDMEVAVAGKEADFLGEDIVKLENIVCDSTRPSLSNKEKIKYEPMLLQYKQQNRQQILQNVKRDRLLQEVVVLKDKENQLEIIARIGIIFGSILFSIGLVLWIVRVQIPQDELIKQQIANLKLDSNVKSKKTRTA